MRTLFLDLGSHSGLIACVAGKDVVVSLPVDHRIDDAGLVPLVEETVAAAGWKLEDVSRLACIVGPGGFTSLRVAVSCANALAWALKIPSCGIHLSDLYASRYGSPREAPQERGEVWWIHSTKKNEIFIRGFGAFAERVPEPMHKTLDDLPSLVWKGDCWMGELLPEHRTVAGGLGMLAAELATTESALPGFLEVQAYEKKLLMPWYGRGW